MSEINTQKPFFIGSCILHAVVLLGLILSISLSGSGEPSASQPNIIQATAVSSSALQQYQNAILAQQQAQQLAAQKAAAQAAAEKLAAEKAAELATQQAAEKIAAAKAVAMKQSIEQQLKASMQKQLAHTPVPKVATPVKSSTHVASPSNSNPNPGLADKYKAMIIQAISEQWVVPQNLPKNISCILDIRVAPGGVVLQVTVKKSSGNPVLDNSAVAAVNKASPLPVPTDASLFDAFRTITLTVRPDGSLLEN